MHATNYSGKRLFSFGTLMDPDVLSCVTGSDCNDLTVSYAVLHGYQQRNVIDENFPVIIEDPESSTTGVLICGMTDTYFERVLFYEGDQYFLAPVPVADSTGTIVDAHVFLSTGMYPTASVQWDYDKWKQCNKSEFLRNVRRYMQYFGKMTATQADQYW